MRKIICLLIRRVFLPRNKACRRYFNPTKYVELQGFSPKDGVREYFYTIDHQGQLFLEGTRIKNFTSCFKETDFLVFFFKRLRTNNRGKYAYDYPYISRCGAEINYVRCENRPTVFTDVIDDQLTMNGIGPRMTVPFLPDKLCMLPRNGRVYHPAPAKSGGVGILKTSLAIEFSSQFVFDGDSNDEAPPTHFVWQGETYTLDNSLWKLLKEENVEELDD